MKLKDLLNGREKLKEYDELKATATAYAADRMRNNRGDVFTREDLYYALRDAYEQGWVDCDTKDMKAESESEFF